MGGGEGDEGEEKVFFVAATTCSPCIDHRSAIAKQCNLASRESRFAFGYCESASGRGRTSGGRVFAGRPPRKQVFLLKLNYLCRRRPLPQPKKMPLAAEGGEDRLATVLSATKWCRQSNTCTVHIRRERDCSSLSTYSSVGGFPPNKQALPSLNARHEFIMAFGRRKAKRRRRKKEGRKGANMKEGLPREGGKRRGEDDEKLLSANAGKFF